jgi:hypothetical protein
MSWASAQRRTVAALKAEERAAVKRQKEIARAIKEQAQLSGLERARLEVAEFENSVEVLLSIHKQVSPTFDWMEPFCALPTHSLNSGMANEEALSDWAKMRALAKRVLAGDEKAYGEALRDLPGLGELPAVGSSATFHVHHRRLVECALLVNGRDAIPAQTKSLTTTGKVSVKAMPKARFHEVYQDYVCGCVLRVAREVFAFLAVDTIIVTAKVSELESSTGTTVEKPILSAAILRPVLDGLDFSRLDPSDSMDNFMHRGDVKASRKSGEFASIVPLHPSEIASITSTASSLPAVLARVRSLREELATMLSPAKPPRSNALEADQTEL